MIQQQSSVGRADLSRRLSFSWADLPVGREGISLLEFRNRSRAGRTEDIPYASKALLQLRFLLGRIFRLDTPSPGQKSASYIRLLNEADRVRFAGATGGFTVERLADTIALTTIGSFNGTISSPGAAKG